MEVDALPEVERVVQAVLGDLPRFGKSGPDSGRAEIVEHETIVDIRAGDVPLLGVDGARVELIDVGPDAEDDRVRRVLASERAARGEHTRAGEITQGGDAGGRTGHLQEVAAS